MQFQSLGSKSNLPDFLVWTFDQVKKLYDEYFLYYFLWQLCHLHVQDEEWIYLEFYE